LKLDPATFKHVGRKYFKDAKKVVFVDYDRAGRPSVVTLENTDPETFISLEIVYNVDPETGMQRDTAEIMSYGAIELYRHAAHYTKDKNHVWFENKIMEHADPATFEFISPEYTKDKNHVYYEGKLVEGADPGTFKEAASLGYQWMDNKNTYESGKKVVRDFSFQ
jgi:hypothetical protein